MHRRNFTDDYNFDVNKTNEGGYSVSLPHQCDEWEIIGADIVWNSQENSSPKKSGEDFTDDYPNLPKNKGLAIKQMELFIKRASEALERLKSL